VTLYLNIVQSIINMKPKESKNKCPRCKDTGFIEIFEPDLKFEVLVSCPACDAEIEKSLMELLKQ